MWIFIFVSFVLFVDIVDMVGVQSNEDKQDGPVSACTIDKKVWVRITNYEDVRMTEQNGVRLSFPLLNNIVKLPDIFKE